MIMNEWELLEKWRDDETKLWLISTSPPSAPPGHLGAKVLSFDSDTTVLMVEYADPPRFPVPVRGASFFPQQHPGLGWVLMITLSDRTDVLIELPEPANLAA